MVRGEKKKFYFYFTVMVDQRSLESIILSAIL